MSNIAMQGGATGTGTVTLLAPSTSTNRTLTLPDASGTIATAESTLTQFNASGSASVYACRAWVNFNGTGTVAIRASGNVSSITDNGTGSYAVNFTTALPDGGYSAVTGGTRVSDSGTDNFGTHSYDYQNGTVKINTFTPFSAAAIDAFRVCVSIFR